MVVFFTWVHKQNGSQLNTSWISTSGMNRWNRQLRITSNRLKNGSYQRKNVCKRTNHGMLKMRSKKTIALNLLLSLQNQRLMTSQLIRTLTKLVMQNHFHATNVARICLLNIAWLLIFVFIPFFFMQSMWKIIRSKMELDSTQSYPFGREAYACIQCGKAFVDQSRLTIQVLFHLEKDVKPLAMKPMWKDILLNKAVWHIHVIRSDDKTFFCTLDFVLVELNKEIVVEVIFLFTSRISLNQVGKIYICLKHV